MNEHINRMEQELEELNVRIAKIEKFIDSNSIYKGLSLIDQELIQAEYNVMKAYSNILDIRISRAYEKKGLYNDFLKSSYE